MSSRSLRLLPALPIGALLFAAFCLPASGQGKDELWDITMKMDMPGMPMAMPARTQRMCVEKSASDDSYVPKQEDCKTVESRRSGNKFTYKMVCTGKNPMTATGEMTFVEGGYEGTMHMTGTMEGRPMDMTQTYSGKRVGNCTSTAKADAKAMEDKSKQSVAEACRSGLENLQAPYFLEPRALCAAQKAEFCGAVSAKAKAMHEPAEFQAAVHKYVDLGGTMSKCGENLPAVAKVACARGMETRNWSFIGSGHCDDDVRTVGDANCKGRAFTGIPGGMGPVCSRYAMLVRGSSPAAEAVDTRPRPAAPAPTPDPVQDGVNQLRKLLPF
jgi:hypothetical protein